MKALNIFELNIFQTGCFMFKNHVLKQTPKVFESLSKVITNKYITRTQGNLEKPFCKTVRDQKSISYRGPLVWNAITKAYEKDEKARKQAKVEENVENNGIASLQYNIP